MRTKNIIIFLALSCSSVFSQVLQSWVQRYNGTANGVEFANKVKVDAAGNIYVTGLSTNNGTGIDYLTIKYNSQGVQQWASFYNGPVNGPDAARSLAVDAQGNVYVTGYSNGSVNPNDYDYATVKYNSSGIQLWVQRVGAAAVTDGGVGLGLDDSGNVYVTGVITGNLSDFGTIKYNPQGVQQWLRVYNGPGSSIDEATAIVVSGTGNVYVTGSSFGSGTGFDYATVKYNSSGIEQWVKRYSFSGNGNDDASDIVIDAQENVYVTGYVYSGSSQGFNYGTVKYNSTGVEQWTAFYNGPGSGEDDAYSVAADNSGNVYVTGESLGSPSSDIATVKYNSSGVQQWVQRYNGINNNYDKGYALILDAWGNIYVAGSSADSANHYNYITLKYNTSGGNQWTAIYNGPGNNEDEARSIAIDNSGSIIVTGYSYGSGTERDYATIKYIQVPDAPFLFSPSNNSSGLPVSLNLIWYKSPGAVNYRVQLASDSLFSGIILNDSSLTDSVKAVSGLLNNTAYWWRVSARNSAGTSPFSQVWKFTTGIVGITQIGIQAPKEFKLGNNYPNPFNPITNVKFQMPNEAFVKLTLYDVLGKEAAIIVNEQLKPGTYEVSWDASNYPSGVYFYKMESRDFSDVKKMVLVK